MTARPRIVLLHATTVAMEPIRNSFAARWPGAETVNLLDDGLAIDRAKNRDLTEDLIERFVAFGRYGARLGADGLLVTCSAFGPAIDRLIAELPIPVLKPNEAMFRAAIAQGTRIGMLATFAPAIVTMAEEFATFAAERGATSTLTALVVDGALEHLRNGDGEAHDRMVAKTALEMAGCDAVMLAQFSTARAAERVRAAIEVPVLTAPDLAVERMKDLVLGAVASEDAGT